ncbi:MAG: hypothetical protein EP335_19250 [Alphaproteobacteria bacterium]|nr:MAG: hypothetical protein EP335_19250 [Alphaproteobacteria bacterium]
MSSQQFGATGPLPAAGANVPAYENAALGPARPRSSRAHTRHNTGRRSRYAPAGQGNSAVTYMNLIGVSAFVVYLFLI